MVIEADLPFHPSNWTFRGVSPPAPLGPFPGYPRPPAPLTAATPKGSTQEDVVPSYGVYLACAELSLILPIVLANTLIIVSVIKFRKLQTLVNSFIVSLAVADLLVGVGSAPIDAMFYLLNDLHSSHSLCLLRYALQVVGLGASITNLTVISIDRFLAVYFPLTYHNKVTPRVAFCFIATAWVSVLAMILPPLVGYHAWDPTKQCDVSNIFYDDYVVFVISSSITLWCLDTALYCCVIRIAMKQMNKIHKTSSKVYGDVNTRTATTARVTRRTQREMKKARMMAMVLGLFILGYFPYAVMASLNHVYGGTAFSLARDISVTIAMCNSCVNGVVYGVMNLDFRCAFYQLLRCNGNRVIDVNIYLDSPSVASSPIQVVQCYRPSVFSIRSGTKLSDSSTIQAPSSSGGQDHVTLPIVD